MSDGDKFVLRVPAGRDPYPMGRHIWHDPRNRNYPVRPLLRAWPYRQTVPRLRPWWRRGVYDQGLDPSCTAQAAAGVVVSSPNRMEHPARPLLDRIDEDEERYELYRAAQYVDPWPGTDYAGSSTDAPFRVLRDRGIISEWRWCFGIEDVLDTLNVLGPVAIGTFWYDSMFYPDSSGHVQIAGSVAGGHAYEVLWNDESDKQVRCINSWGRVWGDNGRFWLTWDQLDRLLREQGEAVVAIIS